MGDIKNGVCFICRQPAEVEISPGEPTGFRCGDCGVYDLVEKDRDLFEKSMEDPILHHRLKHAVKLRFFIQGPSSVRVLLDARWLQKVEMRPKN